MVLYYMHHYTRMRVYMRASQRRIAVRSCSLNIPRGRGADRNGAVHVFNVIVRGRRRTRRATATHKEEKSIGTFNEFIMHRCTTSSGVRACYNMHACVRAYVRVHRHTHADACARAKNARCVSI